jgi:hypothetical protein
MIGGLPFLSSLPHDVQRDEFTHPAFAGNNIPQCSVRGYVGPCPALKFWEFCSKLMTPSLRNFFCAYSFQSAYFSALGGSVNIVSKSELWARKVSIARFEVLVAMAMKFQFCHITPCRLVNSYRRFGRPKCLHFQGIFFYYFTLKIGTALLRNDCNYSLLPIDTAQRRRRLES